MNAAIPAEDALVPPLATGNTPVTPVVNGSPVQDVNTPAVGVPRAGVVRDGDVLNTRLVLVVPVAPAAVYPVILLKAVMLAEDAFVPPFATGRTPVIPPAGIPVQLERLPLLGVPNTGVTKVGEVLKTRFVLVVPVVPAAVNPVMLLKAVMLGDDTFVPPFATGRTPVTPVVNGSPVQETKDPELGVPRAGVVKEGDTFPANAPVPLAPLRPVFTAFDETIICLFLVLQFLSLIL